ncbi:MAG TPA: magnesium-translocating P-type ATPase [Rhizobiales bacterium]|nr:magnesium-translocating P-type ATPase [Hyphomicrobiales bacterium]
MASSDVRTFGQDWRGEGTAGPWWSRSAIALAAELGSAPGGLSVEEAALRLADVGPNAVDEGRRLGALRLFLRQFESPLVLILAFAALVSLALRQWIDAAIILAIVLGSALLGFFQEYRASVAVERLKRRLALSCRVLRDGAGTEIPVAAIVPGDVVMLSAGNLVPADGLVLEAEDFLVSEASMTGESFPVEKTPGTVPADAPLSARTNAVYLGSSVRSGTATVLVVRTGARTAFGTIAERLKARPAETDFVRGVRSFGYLLVRVMVVIVLFVLTANVALDRPAIESLLFAVALAVGLSPELLPAIMTVTLSNGARIMSSHGVIVRRLDAIENLGSMDLLCTDKTGTLTTGEVVLDGAADPRGLASEEVRRLAFLNAALETGIENPLDAAIVAAGEGAGLTTAGYAKVDEIPYDFLRRRLTIVVAPAETPGRNLVVTKGAFENVLAVCTSVAADGGEFALDEALRSELAALCTARGQAGFRVLAVASRAVEARARYGRDDEQNMVFRGFLFFRDPPKADAARTLAGLAALGVRVKVISGDNRNVTAHVARAVGLDAEAMLTGAELAVLRDEALWHLAPRTDLFVEIDPQQKERIVRALQRTGHCVGYLGDGINDAPALHAADVGISVDGAVDVARESADVILLERDLDVLRTGVEEGRRTFANTIKYIAITTSANFGNMVSMALATPLLPFLPLAAKQILLNNFLSDLPSMAISTDAVDPEAVARPQRWDIAAIRRFMVLFGLVSSVFDLLTFALLLFVFNAGEASFQTMWFTISLLTELVVVLVLRTRRSALRSRPSSLLLWSTVVVFALTFQLPFVEPLAAVFGFVPLSLGEFVAIAAIIVGYVIANELAKAWFYRSLPGRKDGT